jgi:hypothetical protein
VTITIDRTAASPNQRRSQEILEAIYLKFIGKERVTFSLMGGKRLAVAFK